MQALGSVLLACLLISAFAAPLNNQISIQDAIAGLQKAELALAQQRQQLEQLVNNGYQHAILHINNNLGLQYADSFPEKIIKDAARGLQDWAISIFG